MRRRLNRKTASDGGLDSEDPEDKRMDTDASRVLRDGSLERHAVWETTSVATREIHKNSAKPKKPLLRRVPT